MRHILIAGLACLAAVPARAECIDDIRAIYRGLGDMKDTRSFGETILGGQVVQKTNGWHKDYVNNMFEVIGRNWWAMSRDGVQYNSTDGKSWQKTADHDPQWEEKARKSAADVQANMTETECLGTEEIDGKTYEVYRYRYVTTEPPASDTVTTFYYDRAETMIFRKVDEFTANGGGKIVLTYTRDPDFTLPDVQR